MAEEKKTSDVAAKKPAKKADAKPEGKGADKKADKKPAKSKKKSKTNPFKSIASFFKSVKSEGKKVVWAKAPDVVRNTIIVLIVCAIVGVAIYLVDSALSYGMKGLKAGADKYHESTSVSEQVEEEDGLSQILEGAAQAADDAQAEAESEVAE